MSIFRKNLDEIEEEGYEQPLLKRKLPKREEDNPPLRRKKKEKAKPWGKKERYLVFTVLSFTVLISVILALSAREWKLPGLPRLKFPSISLFKSETIVIEKERPKVSEELKKASDEVINNFKQEVKDLSGVYGLYIIDLESGYSFGVNEKEIFQAASLIKLPAMAGMYLEEEEKRLSLDNIYSLKAADKVSGAGGLYAKPEGFTLTYKDLVKLMGKQSDNTAFNICKNYLGEERIKEIAKNIGMINTDLALNQTTPEEVGLFFERLYRGEILNEKNKDELMNNLTDTLYEQWVAGDLPKEIKVVHKYGRETHVVNDAGIVFTQKPYVLVLLSKGAVEREADAVLPKLSKMIFDILSNF